LLKHQCDSRAEQGSEDGYGTGEDALHVPS
jgi:hypothetical protein